LKENFLPKVCHKREKHRVKMGKAGELSSEAFRCK
jgi:hypothetical protein